MSDITYKIYSEQKDGWYAIASCPFCVRHVSKYPAKYDGDEGAMAEAVSTVRMHMKGCSENPDREVSGMNALISEAMKPKRD